MPLRVVNWNVEWATPNSRRTAEILLRIAQHSPEVVCLTETHHDLLSRHGHTICSQPDYGYRVKAGHRKVLLWSREPWRDVDEFGIDLMPPGRFVSGFTRTSVGEVAVMGVCIPWFGSRTEASRNEERKKQWEDNQQYLVGLTDVLNRTAVKRLLVMGDFNQIVGQGSRASTEVQLALRRAFPLSMRIATSELVFQGRKSIDHIALGADFAVGSLKPINNIHEGKSLSDHFGMVADLYV